MYICKHPISDLFQAINHKREYTSIRKCWHDALLPPIHKTFIIAQEQSMIFCLRWIACRENLHKFECLLKQLLQLVQKTRNIVMSYTYNYILLSVNNAALWRILTLYLLCRSLNARRFVTFLSFIIKTNNIGCGIIYALSVLLRSVICSNDWSFGVLLYMNQR